MSITVSALGAEPVAGVWAGAYASLMAKRSAGRQRGNAIASSVRLSPSRSPSPLSNTWSFPLAVGLVHILIVQITASLAYAYGTPTLPSNPRDHPFQPLGGLVGKIVNPMQLWDGLWYRLIADEGYERWEAKAAFWPFFPWLMRGVHTLTGLSYETAGYLIANICFLIALVLLYQLVLIDFEPRVAAGTVVAIAVFPTAFFFNVVYTESPFLMLTVAVLPRADRQVVVGRRFRRVGGVDPFIWRFSDPALCRALLHQYGATIRRRITPEVVAVGMPILGPAIFSGGFIASGGIGCSGRTFRSNGPGIRPSRGRRWPGRFRNGARPMPLITEPVADWAATALNGVGFISSFPSIRGR